MSDVEEPASRSSSEMSDDSKDEERCVADLEPTRFLDRSTDVRSLNLMAETGWITGENAKACLNCVMVATNDVSIYVCRPRVISRRLVVPRPVAIC